MNRLIFYFGIVICMMSCDPTSPSPSVDTKIKTLTILASNDTAIYKFAYNSYNQLDTVFKDNNPYAILNYTSSSAMIVKLNSIYRDTFYVYKSSTNYIDSVKDNLNVKRFYRNSSAQLDSIWNYENNHSLMHYIGDMSSNDILQYQQTLPYTCNLYYYCSEISNDTITYSSVANQANLPEQFVGIPLSENFSFLDLNPVFMMQQSDIFPYMPHNHLRENWITKYSIFVTQGVPNRFLFNYQYRFDAQNRVTAMYVYNILTSVVVPFRQYFMTY